MQDLNDLFYFSEVVSHGGFAAAGRALGIPKSKLSRRVAQLEKRLGARLIERTSRRFRVTEIGRSFHERCRSALAEVANAEALVAAVRAEPSGTVRFSCPTAMTELIALMLPDFLRRYPRIKASLVATDRAVDLIEDRIDVALRVRLNVNPDPGLMKRTLAKSRRVLVASPALANAVSDPQNLQLLAQLPTLSSAIASSVTWELEGPQGRVDKVTHEPRVACEDLQALREAALAGLGVAFLPDHACAEALLHGRLVRLFPEWHSREGIIHLVFAARTELPPHVVAWVDYLADRFRDRSLFGPVGLVAG